MDVDALKEQHENYVNSHPELRDILSSFLSEVLLQKPQNVWEFARDYFSKEQPKTTNTSTTSTSGSDASSSAPPFIICGPSGVGKGTLITRLMSEFSNLGFSVSHTTRSPREGEVNGVHYHFVSKENIEEAIKNGEFVEHAYVHGNIYGTSAHSIRAVSSQGKICVLDIDVQGVQSVLKTDLNPKILYVAPPSHEELEKRLRGRGTETEEAIAKRLGNAKREMEWLEQPGNTHHKLVNEDLEIAYQELRAKLQEWYPDLLTRT